jgi:hypothetical protein
MTILNSLAGPALLMMAGVAAAKPMPTAHEQHQATAEHAANAADQRCCCEDHMRQMMIMKSQMMKQHEQGMRMPVHPQGPTDPPKKDEHQH